MADTMADQLHKLQVTYQPGEVIIHEGEASTEVFVLMKGSACVQVNGQTIRTLDVEDGDVFFGELATILERPRTATVSALTTCKALKIPGGSLMEVLARCPRLLEGILHQMAARTVYMDEMRRIAQARAAAL